MSFVKRKSNRWKEKNCSRRYWNLVASAYENGNMEFAKDSWSHWYGNTKCKKKSVWDKRMLEYIDRYCKNDYQEIGGNSHDQEIGGNNDDPDITGMDDSLEVTEPKSVVYEEPASVVECNAPLVDIDRAEMDVFDDDEKESEVGFAVKSKESLVVNQKDEIDEDIVMIDKDDKDDKDGYVGVIEEDWLCFEQMLLNVGEPVYDYTLNSRIWKSLEAKEKDEMIKKQREIGRKFKFEEIGCEVCSSKKKQRDNQCRILVCDWCSFKGMHFDHQSDDWNKFKGKVWLCSTCQRYVKDGMVDEKEIGGVVSYKGQNIRRRRVKKKKNKKRKFKQNRVIGVLLHLLILKIMF